MLAAILGMDELSEEDRIMVSRTRKIQRFPPQPYFVAEALTGTPGKHVMLAAVNARPPSQTYSTCRS